MYSNIAVVVVLLLAVLIIRVGVRNGNGRAEKPPEDPASKSQ
jgi:hypothetical protein